MIRYIIFKVLATNLEISISDSAKLKDLHRGWIDDQFFGVEQMHKHEQDW